MPSFFLQRRVFAALVCALAVSSSAAAQEHADDAPAQDHADGAPDRDGGAEPAPIPDEAADAEEEDELAPADGSADAAEHATADGTPAGHSASVPAEDSAAVEEASHAPRPDGDGAYPDDAYPEDAERYPEEDPSESAGVRYFLDRVDVRGENRRTRASVVRSYVHLEHGDVVDPEDPLLERIEWRLRGTGWFSSVNVRLERAERRGWVVIVVEVEERNTIVVEGLTFGISEGLNNTLSTSSDLLFYVGATVAETNLLGTGARLALSGLGSTRARGVRLDYVNPRLFSNGMFLRSSFFYNNAREYFGNDPLVDAVCPEDLPDCEPQNAVVFYKRGGFSLGTGRDFGQFTRVTFDWQGEYVSVRSLPNAASEDRGGVVRPIDFAILPGQSLVSALRLNLAFDRRDDPVVTTRGTTFTGAADLGTGAIGSDYDFLRVQLQLRHWVRLDARHALRFGAYVGAIFGEAPFFYKFHVSDFTGFVPGRYLEMQLDRRQAPNAFGTSIEVMRQQELAARLDVQYETTLYRGGGALRTLVGFVNIGVLSLADRRDLRTGFPAFRGVSQFPLDLSVDIGLRFDASFGVFEVGFSNILGFVSL